MLTNSGYLQPMIQPMFASMRYETKRTLWNYHGMLQDILKMRKAKNTEETDFPFLWIGKHYSIFVLSEFCSWRRQEMVTKWRCLQARKLASFCKLLFRAQSGVPTFTRLAIHTLFWNRTLRLSEHKIEGVNLQQSSFDSLHAETGC